MADIGVGTEFKPHIALSVILCLCVGCGGNNSSSPGPLRAAAIYVANYGPQQGALTNCRNPPSITVYASDAGGDTAPAAEIEGNQTGITGPTSVAVDGSGQIYVANAAAGVNSILVFAAEANGNVAPVRTIAGAATGLNLPFGVAVDGAGNIFVANTGGPSVLEFGAGASGAAPPIAVIAGGNTGFSPPPLGPLGISLDSQGRIHVPNPAADSIAIFAPGANGNAVPAVTIGGAGTQLNGPIQAGFDAKGTIYVSNNGHCFPDCPPTTQFALTEYPAGSAGNAPPSTVIAGSNTNLFLPAGIAVDPAGDIFVTNQNDNSVEVFAAGSQGKVTPAIIKGPATRICTARALAVH